MTRCWLRMASLDSKQLIFSAPNHLDFPVLLLDRHSPSSITNVAACFLTALSCPSPIHKGRSCLIRSWWHSPRCVFFLVFQKIVIIVVLLAISRLNEAVTLRSKQLSLQYKHLPYQKRVNFDLAFCTCVRGSKFSQGGPDFAGKFVPGGTYFRAVQILRDSTIREMGHSK